MKKEFVVWLFILVLIVLFISLVWDWNFEENSLIGNEGRMGEESPLTSHPSLENSVCFDDSDNEKDICIEVEIVDDVSERAKGLMFRESLGEGSGMLFVYDEVGEYSFWMKNTLIPLDMIWIDEEMRIVDIKNAVPCVVEECISYGGEVSASYVLEVNAGFVEEKGLEVGDEVVINIK